MEDGEAAHRTRRCTSYGCNPLRSQIAGTKTGIVDNAISNSGSTGMALSDEEKAQVEWMYRNSIQAEAITPGIAISG
ncbi:hypothetical protein [Microseira sp. BLCC-F43]|uniref:hypothetical protein n=1 Tax=Microseira sp. BLCC-F43 TaxID=3153602 RepID=UPI0035BAFA63